MPHACAVAPWSWHWGHTCRDPLPPRRIIAENFLEGWWRDLDETLSTDKHVDTRRIHTLLA